ncbi:hypothetical protein EON65_02275 [archaeon]|nr:MAG: hypothetical protein EON65_02275 [archaeon]
MQPNLIVDPEPIIDIPAQMIQVDDDIDDDSDFDSDDDSDEDEGSDDEYPDYSGRTTNCNIVNATNDTLYFVNFRRDCGDNFFCVNIPHGVYKNYWELEYAIYQANRCIDGGCLKSIYIDDEDCFTFEFAQYDDCPMPVNFETRQV